MVIVKIIKSNFSWFNMFMLIPIPIAIVRTYVVAHNLALFIYQGNVLPIPNPILHHTPPHTPTTHKPPLHPKLRNFPGSYLSLITWNYASSTQVTFQATFYIKFLKKSSTTKHPHTKIWPFRPYTTYKLLVVSSDILPKKARAVTNFSQKIWGS